MEENNKSNKVKHKPLKIILNCVAWIIIGLIVVVSAVNIIDRMTKYNFPFFGLRYSVVVSESMSKDFDPRQPITGYQIGHIQKNDVVITINYQKYEDIQIGDVLTYYVEDKGLICHRVSELYTKQETQYIVTKGDANGINDLPITFNMVKGKVFSVIGGIGTFISFIQSGYMLIALLFSIGIIFLVIYIYRVTEDRKKLKEEKLNEK